MKREEKEAFFALYWGQKIIRYKYDSSDSILKWPVDAGHIHGTDGKYLELRPISSLTYDELKNIGFKFREDQKESISFEFSFSNYSFHWKCEQNGFIKEGYLILKDFDYLRSKGYALPWMGFSVDDLVNEGVVKLKEETK